MYPFYFVKRHSFGLLYIQNLLAGCIMDLMPDLIGRYPVHWFYRQETGGEEYEISKDVSNLQSRLQQGKY